MQKKTHSVVCLFNANTRWNEHKNKNNKSESAKYLKENPALKFRWTIISKVPKNFHKHRVLEAHFIKIICPTLNEQLSNDSSTPFRNDIT